MGGKKVPESFKFESNFVTLSCNLVSTIFALTLSLFCSTTYLWCTRVALLPPPEVLLEEWLLLSCETLTSEWLWRNSEFPDLLELLPERIQGWRKASSGARRFLGFQLKFKKNKKLKQNSTLILVFLNCPKNTYSRQFAIKSMKR